MGYYTTFAVKVEENGKEIDFSIEMQNELVKITREINNNDIEELVEGWLHSKWYSYRRDFKLLSEKFPDIIFTLEGQGEDTDDFWRHYFFNGKDQFAKAQITYEEFDETLLEY